MLSAHSIFIKIVIQNTDAKLNYAYFCNEDERVD